MTVPFHLLPSDQDQRDREMLGSQRLKETLCSMPFYGNRAAKAAKEGKEMDYWVGLWRSGVNSLYPAKASSTAEAMESKWTTEEAVMSTPYSETEEWRKILEQQFLDGGFNGPAGMWEEVVARLSKPL